MYMPASYWKMSVRADIKRIYVHHTKTDDNTVLSNFSAIEKYHMSKGWVAIGYHYIIEFSGKSVSIIKGRPENRVGAHVLGDNGNSIGIAIVGDYDKDKLNEKKYYALIYLLMELMDRYNIPVDGVLGHREAPIMLELGIISDYYSDYYRNFKKTCPGVNVSMRAIREQLRSYGFPVANEELYNRLNVFDTKFISSKVI